MQTMHLQGVSWTILLSCRTQNLSQFSWNTSKLAVILQASCPFSKRLFLFLLFSSHLPICRTTGTFPSLIWRRHSQRGRLCTSILHCKEGRSAPGHLLVFPRVKHHLGARDCHHSVGCSRQLPDDSLCGSQAQGHLHLQSIQCSRSADRASGSQC